MQHKFGILAGVGSAVLGLTIAAGAVLAAGPHGVGVGSAAGASVGAHGTGSGGYGAYGSGPGAGADTATQARTRAIAAGLAQPQGTLTDVQASSLAGLASEEKLALDLYTALGEQYRTPVWGNIAAAEATHLDAVRTLLARYGIADPTAGRSAGDFATLDTTSLYRSLLAQGAGSESAAWAAGVAVEQDDIATLDTAASGVTAPDVAAVEASLRSASEQHLAAFTRLLGN